MRISLKQRRRDDIIEVIKVSCNVCTASWGKKNDEKKRMVGPRQISSLRRPLYDCYNRSIFIIVDAAACIHARSQVP